MQPAWQNMDGHFVVSCLDAPVAAGATRVLLDSTALDVYGDVPVIAVLDLTQKAIGYLLGTVIDPDNKTMPRCRLQLDVVLTPDNLDQIVETQIYRLAGSFLFVLDVFGHRRIYLDADGAKSCVYDPVTKRAASTVMALLDEDEYWARLDHELYQALEVGQAGWFSAGLTAHTGIKRLICNHYLDLETWGTVRHWPVAAIDPSSDPAASFDAIMGRTSATIETLANAGNVNIALTAGTDSRFILASSRDLVDRITVVTVAAPAAKLDVACASELARRLGLRHKILPYREASSERAQTWQIRAGHCISGVNMKMHPSVEPLKKSFFVGGLGGEVGRGFLWLTSDADTPIDAAGIVARLKLPRHPAVVAGVDAWLAPIAHFDTLLKLDLAYLELRMSSWGFADAYANPVRTELHPMISRANFEAMLSIPPEMRRDGSIFRDAITRAWPELMALPINKYGDWRDVRKKAFDVVADPRRAVRKVRQLLLSRPGLAQ